MYDYGWGGHWGMGYGVGWIFMVLFWLLVIVAIAAVVKWLFTSTRSPATHTPTPNGKSPLDVLKMRYARGEIGREEYEERRRVLEE